MDKKTLKKKIDTFENTRTKEKFQNLTFTIILIQSENAGNIGAIARVMKNFGFNNLIIFNPCESVERILSYETDGFAMHGKDILQSSEIITLINQEDHYTELKKLLSRFNLIIGTTAKGIHYRNVRRLSIFIEDLELPISSDPLEIGILFGKESRGLNNKEIELADILVRIPASEKYPTLNISHACGIILYEIFKKLKSMTLGRGIHPVILATKEDKGYLYKTIQNLIDILKIRSYKKENVLISFKNVFERALISTKELSLILGLFSKINSILKKKKLFED
jgi:tRNA/rRNA methyltransferase